MSENMIGIKEAAENWELTSRRVGQLCGEGLIKGAYKDGGRWKIPADAQRPDTACRSKRQSAVPYKRLLPCPVGITSYKEVSSECYYVDKTLLIKNIIDEHSKVMLFTRPRRFGKTLTMDMLKTYFEKTDEDTSVYFADRAIWRCDDIYKSYQNAYPVIFLSFKDAHQSSWKAMYESLFLTLRDEFQRHASILESEAVSDTDKDFFRRMLKGEVSEVECQACLGQLSRMLFCAEKARVVVIIDEYDTPIEQGYSGGYYNEVVAFMRNLFSAVLKDNPELQFSVLTGILRVAKESLFSGLNNLTVNTILDTKYAEYFGFTPREVEEMATYYNRKEKLPELKEWYDGYRFGTTEIYNPWSVISYFNNNCVPKAFWSRTSGNGIVLSLVRGGTPEMKASLMKLMQNRSVQTAVDTDIIYPEIKSSEDTVYSFLLMTGYLKAAETVATLDDIPVAELLLPNKEIKSVFKKEILDQLSESVSLSVIREFQLALRSNDQERLEKTLCRYLIQCAGCFDTAGESFYHGMMLGLLAIMSDAYRISSNRESGEGRFDIQLTPLSKELPGILMEFKAAKNAGEESLLGLAEKAVEQIKARQYATELNTVGITGIQLYGIAFSGKRAAVKSERI